MATRRMLSKSISLSRQVDSVCEKAQLLFTWMIPHADDEGRMIGDPKYIKVTVVPLKTSKGWTISGVEKCLLELCSVGLIYYWYQAGERYVQFPTWDQYQTIQLDRATLSRIPCFDSTKAKDASEFPDINPTPDLDTRRIQEIVGVETQYKLSKDNIREFNLRTYRLGSILKELRERVSKIPSDPRVSQLIDYFFLKVQEKKGFKPEIRGGQDGYLLKTRLAKYSDDQIKALIDGYLESEDCEKLGSTLGICLSTSVVNKWLEGKLKKRGQIREIS